MSHSKSDRSIFNHKIVGDTFQFIFYLDGATMLLNWITIIRTSAVLLTSVNKTGHISEFILNFDIKKGAIDAF